MDCPPGEINPYQKVSQVLIYIEALFILVVMAKHDNYDFLIHRILASGCH